VVEIEDATSLGSSLRTPSTTTALGKCWINGYPRPRAIAAGKPGPKKAFWRRRDTFGPHVPRRPAVQQWVLQQGAPHNNVVVETGCVFEKGIFHDVWFDPVLSQLAVRASNSCPRAFHAHIPCPHSTPTFHAHTFHGQQESNRLTYNQCWPAWSQPAAC
jgi:hypothetical protein